MADASLEIRSGTEPSAADDVVVDAATAEKYELRVGQTIRILFQGPPGEFTISGIVGFGDADSLGGATLALFETATAQRVLDREGRFDEIDVVAGPRDAGSAPDPDPGGAAEGRRGGDQRPRRR
ncbi:MAG: hypothetical protein U0V56_04360 [Actinomycetota bacterium]